MKRVFVLFTFIGFTTFYGFSQATETFDYISPFNEGFAAVKKGNQWAFINDEGAIVVNFRDDIMKTKATDAEYPIFNNGRCLIVKKENGISYFGYIDTTGKTVIEPTFLNANNFHNKVAIVLKMNKEKVGYNNVLGKDIVYYTYVEAIINTNGEITNTLTEPINIVLNKKALLKLPKITSKRISKNLIAIMNKEKKWVLKRISKQ